MDRCLSEFEGLINLTESCLPVVLLKFFVVVGNFLLLFFVF